MSNAVIYDSRVGLTERNRGPGELLPEKKEDESGQLLLEEIVNPIPTNAQLYELYKSLRKDIDYLLDVSSAISSRVSKVAVSAYNAEHGINDKINLDYNRDYVKNRR